MPSTLSDLITAVEKELQDTANAFRSDAELTEHLRRALRALNQVAPQRALSLLHTTMNVLEYDLAAIAGFMEITDVWYPWNAADPAWPPSRPAWSLLDGHTLRLEVAAAPVGDDTDNARLFYTLPNTLSGLDAATTTTLDAQGEQALILGAAAYAVEQRAQRLANAVTATAETPRHYAAWARQMAANFAALLEGLRRRQVP
jgi:hypothetical protein